jgi:hypothetical protein
LIERIDQPRVGQQFWKRERKKKSCCGNEKVGIRRGKSMRLVKKGNEKMEVFTNSKYFKTNIFWLRNFNKHIVGIKRTPTKITTLLTS